MRNEERIKQLESHREVLLRYLQAKVFASDWHAVSDAANDLREIEVELRVWRELPDRIAVHNGKMHAEAAARSVEVNATAGSKPPAQGVFVSGSDFHEPMGANKNQDIHQLFSDYGFQRFVISKFGATPSDIGDYDWTDYCVHNYIGNDGGSGAKLAQLIEEYRGAANVNKLPNIS